MKQIHPKHLFSIKKTLLNSSVLFSLLVANPQKVEDIMGRPWLTVYVFVPVVASQTYNQTYVL